MRRRAQRILRMADGDVAALLLSLDPPCTLPSMAYAAFVFVCLVWGSTFILMERVSHALGPVEIGAWRLFLGSAALGVIWWWKRDVYRLERRDWGPILVSALVANVPAYVSQPYVIAQGFGHSFFGVVVAAIPLLTIVMSIQMLGIRPTRRQLWGVIGGLVCLWFVVEEGIDRGMSWGLLALAAVVPITAAFNNTYIKLKLPDAAALPMTAAMLGSAGLMLLPVEFCLPAIEALDLSGPANPVFTPMTWVYLLVLGVVATGLSTVAFFYMVLKEGPLFAGMTTYVVPILALAWGELDHETISLRQLAAMAGVLVMVALVQTSSARSAEPIELEAEAPAAPDLAPSVLRHEKPFALPVTIAAAANPESPVSST